MTNHQEHFQHFGTNAVHAGQEPEQWDANQIIPPISLSTTFKQSVPGMPMKYDYSRAGNPSRDVLEKCLASLEGGEYCRVYSSGLAATMAITNMLKSGDHIVCSDDVYGGTQRYFRKVSVPQHNLKVSFVDMTDLNALSEILNNNTKRPLSLGADAVLHSITKYINGHSDVVMGAVITSNKSLDQCLKFQQLAVGAVPSPFDCFLVNRGVKTLHVRMQAHMANAMQVASFLENNPRIERVLYPELKSHPQYEIHKKQTTGMSGMMSFYLKGGLHESQEFLSSLKIFTLAESLGGFESLAELPALMTHASVPLEDRIKLGIGDNLIRISVGIEDVEDLIEDIDEALKKAD